MKTIGAGCDACKALPGEKCRNIGYGDEKMNKSGFHVSRARRAHYITLGERREKRERG